MDNEKIQDDWWPDLLRPIADENPHANEQVLIAEIGHSWGADTYRHLYTALVPHGNVGKILEHRGGIDHEVSTSGPHPYFSSHAKAETFEPKFWVETGGLLENELEPLVVSWESANQRYIAPDQGLLMTYGLIPRITSSPKGQEIHWDDPTIPVRDVIISRSVSVFNYPSYTDAFVRIKRNYLQDYATIRGCDIVQIYYAEVWGAPPEEINSFLGEAESRKIALPGRLIEVRILKGTPRRYLAKVWGVRHLIAPKESPVTEGRWQYGELAWPGIQGLVRGQKDIGYWTPLAYVSDQVLEHYEGRSEFSIHPESGGVSYGIQWSSGNTQRVGRDLITVELKKLYEGTPPEVVQHWHKFAVLPPTEGIETLRLARNIATRARRIAYAVATLGESLATVATHTLSKPFSSKELTGLSSQEMDYVGWWNNSIIEPITRHAPLSMTREEFLKRCQELDQLVVEGLNEATLRQVLIRLGEDKEKISGFRSIKLLVRLVELASIANHSGHRLMEDSKEIQERAAEHSSTNFLQSLFILHELRTAASHRGSDGHQNRVEDALRYLQLNVESTKTGWGHVFDAILDAVANDLESANQIISQNAAS